MRPELFPIARLKSLSAQLPDDAVFRRDPLLRPDDVRRPNDAVLRPNDAESRPTDAKSRALSSTGVAVLEDPTFLICSERSGSNLLRAILDAHSQIHAPIPLHLGRDIWANLYRYGDLSCDENWDTLIRDVVARVRVAWGDLDPQLTADELRNKVEERAFQNIYKYVYVKGMMAAGKSRVFIKENHTHHQAFYLLEHFAKPKFVFKIRDPRDYVLSCKRVSRLLPHYDSVSGAIGVWMDDQRGALNIVHALPASQTFMLRYEDLLADPEAVLRALCQFLDVPYEAEMLRFYEQPAAKRAAKSNPAYWKNLARPLLRNNVQKYRSGLRRIEIRTIEFRLGALMRRFGYKPDMSPPGVFHRMSIKVFELLGFFRSRVVALIRRRKDRKDGWSLPGHASHGKSAIRYQYQRRSDGPNTQKCTW